MPAPSDAAAKLLRNLRSHFASHPQGEPDINWDTGYMNLHPPAHLHADTQTVYAWRDPDSALVVLGLDAAALDWLIDSLPSDDRATKDLVYARRLARHAAYNRDKEHA